MTGFAKLVAMLGLDSREYHRGMETAKTSTKSFESAFNGLQSRIAGFVSAGSFLAGFRKFASAIGAIRDQSQQMGSSFEFFQVIKEKATNAGIKMEQFAAVFSKIRAAQGDAIRGGENSPIVKALKALNIEAADFAGMNPDQAFDTMARAVARAKGDVSQLSAVFDIIGKETGPRLQRVMAEIGATGMDSLAEGMRRNGRMISDTTIAVFGGIEAAWNKTIDRLFAGLSELIDNAAKAQPGNLKEYLLRPQGTTVEMAGLGPKRKKRSVSQEDISKAQVKKLDEEERAASAQAAIRAATEAATTRERLKQMELLARAQDDLNKVEREGQMAALDPAGRRAMLQGEADTIQRRLDTIEQLAGKELEVVKLKAEQARLANQIAEADRESLKTETDKAKRIADRIAKRDQALSKVKDSYSSGDPSRYADSMARIGGYIGGQQAVGMSAAERTAQAAEKLCQILGTFQAGED